ncbi:Chondroitin polymerase [Aminobacter sp. MSH1]|uniref:glycosyltransferase family 2 protein n=1 Tax=Aminobacter sp. MSH1 TaxID=374606 RepID=UPI000D395562|nr:glycosyltransferase family 2 protein [Aminobacter sp. MSH1]AWC23030.1 Chondroitin polymerase [Aminobacter sp. MSH1]
MQTSVIISTYNSPLWLQKVLWGYFAQDRHDFELVIADDGSSDETREMLAAMAPNSPVPIAHVWQPDEGFQKCRILNKAIAVAQGERILLTDGDCVPRRDFVEVHTRLAQPDRFLTGGYFKLPPNVSKALTQDDIAGQQAFNAFWLMRHGLPFTSKLLKVVATSPFDEWLNRLTPARPTWNGHSASCLRSQAIQINGFNEDMQYGGLDVEFGLRLRHVGIEPRHIRYSAIALHLHHGHGYVTQGMKERSHGVKENTRHNRLTWAERGLSQWLDSSNRATLLRDDRLTRF